VRLCADLPDQVSETTWFVGPNALAAQAHPSGASVAKQRPLPSTLVVHESAQLDQLAEM
jgi:hypothetical protein